jgi:hypothetical protein
MSISENYEGEITPIRSNISRLSRGTGCSRRLCVACYVRGNQTKLAADRRLFFENQPRSAYLMGLEGNIDFDAVGYLDEWNPAVHAKFLAVKSHGALN